MGSCKNSKSSSRHTFTFCCFWRPCRKFPFRLTSWFFILSFGTTLSKFCGKFIFNCLSFKSHPCSYIKVWTRKYAINIPFFPLSSRTDLKGTCTPQFCTEYKYNFLCATTVGYWSLGPLGDAISQKATAIASQRELNHHVIAPQLGSKMKYSYQV
uniref:Uncharacterized protein n=1 Tax=Aplanochytrium stocchinoi TaxID=215587 RepID=A0A7S3PHZ3_9STRA